VAVTRENVATARVLSVAQSRWRGTGSGNYGIEPKRGRHSQESRLRDSCCRRQTWRASKSQDHQNNRESSKRTINQIEARSPSSPLTMLRRTRSAAQEPNQPPPHTFRQHLEPPKRSCIPPPCWLKRLSVENQSNRSCQDR
jgi:hypothetical protein